MRYLITLTLLFLNYSCFAGLPEPTNVREEEKEKEIINDAADRNELLNHFKSVYDKRGQPKFTVMWNKGFDDVLSDWQHVATRSTHNETITAKSDENNLNIDYEISSNSLMRKPTQFRPAPTELDVAEFQTGFTNVLLAAKVNLVDRDTLLRLAANNSTQKNTPYDLDTKAIETQAFLDMTDYVMELFFLIDSDDYLGFRASSNVKQIKTGKVIAHVVSELNEIQTQSSWEPNSTGFVQVSRVIESPTFNLMGEELAYETLQRLSDSEW